ncbi:hypothetical protein LPJ61_004613 [Coemansia biformis]|uniref:lytic cellulose monooxygenase (C4-dehydrogenating) n=1 Tax=Coemansia biformis TaxID=1286918 RepID=A0A9W7YBH9_9FUNG|nr:hypothetical protein LPJ61_004613 [Coemansia biformis]
MATAVAVLVSLSYLASAHTLLTTISTNGKKNGLGECIRPWWLERNHPIRDVKTTDLRCRTKDLNGSTTKACPVAAGSTMSIAYHRNTRPDSDVISQSHTGPVMVYLAPLASNGEGEVWFKIFEDGWTKESNEWGTDRLIKNNGEASFTIPADIKPGDYLLRTEIIALHNARTLGGAQFYPNCAHITVTGGGSVVPPGVAIPGYYKDNDPGILYSRKKFGDNSKYVIPGPPVYKGGAGTAPPKKPVCTKRKARKRHDL